MESNFYKEDLIQVRQILEIAAVKIAAEKRTSENLNEIEKAQAVFIDQTLHYDGGIEEDMMFHLTVVSASQNDVLKSLFMKIIPDLIYYSNKTKPKNTRKYFKSIPEHDSIIEHLINQNIEGAEEVMKLHLEN